jgi:hypothetical protein
MLGEWSAADPVSKKETDRNEAVYAIQGNRNPFIDHPEYIYSIWGVGKTGTDTGTEPATYPANLSASSIKLEWTDATGTYVPDGYLIRMSTTGFDAISAPVDGTVYPDSNTDKNVTTGTQQVYFNKLSSGSYYFRIL